MFVALAIGLYVFTKNPRAATNRLFLIYCVVNCLWYLATMFEISAPTASIAAAWYVVEVCPTLFSAPTFAHFLLALIDFKPFRRHPWAAAVLYLPAVVFTYMNIANHAFPFTMVATPLGWSAIQDLSSPWGDAAYAYTFAYVIAMCILMIRWGRRSKQDIHKKQARLIVVSVCVGVVLYTSSSSLAQVPRFNYVGAVGHLFILVWIIGIAYAILQYRLMVLTPQDAAYSIYSTMADGVLLLDPEGLVVSANPASLGILRLRETDVVMRPLEESIPGSSAIVDQRLKTEGIVRDEELTFVGSSRQEMHLSFSASPIQEKSGTHDGTVFVFRDITERKLAEKRLQHVATHDMLTRLPNRVLLNDRLRIAISQAERRKCIVAVLLMDLDKFKDVNDRHGHDAGDRLLVEVAERLSRSVREYDTVSRLGGDEFVVVLTDLKDQQDCNTVIARIRAAFSKTIKFEKFELLQTLSIGVSLYPSHADNIEDLYKCADTALYRAKAQGRNDLQYYSKEEGAIEERKASIEKDLGSALANEEFEIFYQPVVNISSRRLIALEALVRWNHPLHGVISPLDFIPYAERTGLIISLGEMILRQVCRQVSVWQSKGSAIPVTVNLSARQFQDPELFDKVVRALDQFHVPPELIKFELTESTAMIDMDKAAEIAGKLKQRGIDIIVDDFGSGYSSMIWLKYLKPVAIKIDRFFIQNLAFNSADAAIVKAIIFLAHSLDMVVIAEGIESQEQLEAIRALRPDNFNDLSCDHAQGYFFSRPVPASIVETLFPAQEPT